MKTKNYKVVTYTFYAGRRTPCGDKEHGVYRFYIFAKVVGFLSWYFRTFDYPRGKQWRPVDVLYEVQCL